MAMYGMSFSVGHILGPNIGMQFSAAYGFDRTWYLMALVCVLAGIILLVLRRKNPV
jgi:predicted MFS family arabinose efflux permease